MTDNPYESPTAPGNAPQSASKGIGLIPFLVVVGIIFVLAALLLLPNVRGAREAARRMTCANNLHNIAIALKQYESIYHAFPPAYTADAAGEPLHSWRTLILPYLEQKALYEQIDLTKPWDDPANKNFFGTHIPVYHCPSSSAAKGQTTYLAITVPGGFLAPSESRKMRDITDGSSNTLMVLEVRDDHSVPWMCPQDLDGALLAKLGTTTKPSHFGGFMAVFADGHTQFLPADLKPDVLRALITIAGNDNNILRDL